MIGIFRYVRHGDVADRMAQGWRWCNSLLGSHGEYSALMWWCCGACADGEAP